MSNKTHHAGHPSRLRVAEGVLKALFTTSPLRTSDVIVKKGGAISVVSSV